jgi:hypothetical protein
MVGKYNKISILTSSILEYIDPKVKIEGDQDNQPLNKYLPMLPKASLSFVFSSLYV